MKIRAKHDNRVNLLEVSAAESCDTDSWPLVPQLQFRHYRSTLDPEIGAIAATILFARHCGSVVELDGAKISIDAARAIRTILPEADELLPVNGMKRDISQGVVTLISGEAGRMFATGGAPNVGTSARAVTWCGDFVTPGRNSSQYIGGDIFTNAALVAGYTEISVALALFVGGKAVRDIYVPPPEEPEQERYHRIADGLEHVGIKLRML
jgi:hypothetical protein